MSRILSLNTGGEGREFVRVERIAHVEVASRTVLIELDCDTAWCYTEDYGTEEEANKRYDAIRRMIMEEGNG